MNPRTVCDREYREAVSESLRPVALLRRGVLLLVGLAVAGVLLSGCAGTSSRAQAYGGVGADAVSTAVAVAGFGAVEANPLGWWLWPFTAGLIEHAETLPDDERVRVHHAISASRWGVAVHNICSPFGGLFCVIPGAVVSGVLWAGGAAERAFFDACMVHKVVVGNPALLCSYSEAGHAL